ncbi:MAG: 5-oxoprolinase subunit PxpB [Kangiellaceae bacterium]|nr:5-oxoprolinase subunit PxpB [Kangiellaceae bacterium]MCW8998699.1 5-oxoprolinase subunit PxpB [Kangiellaceae bacterium]MCW9015940.1 5-oxoprolinase subunit PxpB [Kangiellaceae bacterium]
MTELEAFIKQDITDKQDTAESPSFRILHNGDSALTVIFDEQVSDGLSLKIIALRKVLKTIFSNKLTDIIPAYQSLTLIFNLDRCSKQDSTPNTLRKVINVQIAGLDTKSIERKSRIVKIPVCYHYDVAPDLESFCKFTKLTLKQVIELHTMPKYRVNMLGFLPGFFYLSGLDKKLYMPRKSTPSLNVEAGSVGIGNNQTGVYPVDSPGGWQIIGKTPTNLFEPTNSTDKFLVNPFDQVQFEPISLKEFTKLVEGDNDSSQKQDAK